MISKVVILFCVLSSTSAQWGWGGYGNGNPPPPTPNNNVGIGYPTAYGLMVGRPNNNNGYGPAPNGPGTGFGSPLRCLNGGAHIGQCRLDQDSICMALGGTCIHGSCCTTPFSGMNKATSVAPVIEGDVSAPVFTRPTTTKAPVTVPEEQYESEESEVKQEREEMSRIIAASLTSSTSPSTTRTIETVPLIVDHATQCESGLRAVGPCAEDTDCPTLHRCETNMCCYVVD